MLFFFYFHGRVLSCGQLCRLLLVAQTLTEVHVPSPIFLNFLYFHHKRGYLGLPSPLAAVLRSHLPDCIIDASVLLDDLLMVRVALYGIAGPNIVAHHLIDADTTFLLSCQIEQPAHRCQKFYVALVFHSFPVIFLGVFADGPSSLHLLARIAV